MIQVSSLIEWPEQICGTNTLWCCVGGPVSILFALEPKLTITSELANAHDQ